MLAVKKTTAGAVAALAALMMFFSGIVNTPTASAAGGRAYVGMGDSFAANPTVPQQFAGFFNGGCGQGTDTYVDRIGRQRFGGNYANIACNGVTVSGHAGPGVAHLAEQAKRRGIIGPNTRLVTITVGAAEGWNPARLNGRDFGITGGGAFATQQRWNDRMGSAIRRIKRVAPNARIMVVGYPEVTRPDRLLCTSSIALGNKESLDVGVPSGIGEMMHNVNRIASRGTHLGYEYVNTVRPDTGTCAHPNRQWVHGILDIPGENDRMPVHPTSRGNQGIANIVKARL